MKEVYIKYNPYALKTEFTVDNQELRQNGNLYNMIFQGKETRLQDWIEELPNELKKEYNTKDFQITFYGTKLDYNDVEEICKEATNKGIINAKVTHRQAKEAKDKEKEIDKVFREIEKGPIEELKNDKIKEAFKRVKDNKDFEICVVATMSSGKSTLINALLGRKLMPAAQEACTAIITKIRDSDEGSWKVEVYSRDGRIIKRASNIDYKTMQQLNNDETIGEIDMTGDIPFVTTQENTLVLVDTPGPNNARNKDHRKIQEKYLGKSSQSLVLYIMEPTFGSDSDDALLSSVANSMKVDGKQSKDRFIFVVNKMDGRSSDDGNITDTLNRVRNYLKDKGIENPNLFPIAALPALNIRRVLNDKNVDMDTEDEAETSTRKLNRDRGKDLSLHFEQYATLPKYLKEKINKQLEEDMQNDRERADYLQALVHTGVPSVEEAIKQYVDKYATTKRIRDLVDTFQKSVEEQECMNNLQNEIMQDKEKGEQIRKQISEIKTKLNSAEEAKKFKSTISQKVIETKEASSKSIDDVVLQFQSKISDKIEDYKGHEISLDKVDIEIKKLEKYAEKDILPLFEANLSELIKENLIKTSNNLITAYKEKLGSLVKEVSVMNSIKIDALDLMQGSIQLSGMNEIDIEKLIEEKEVEDGEEYVKNTDKAWWKPWTWFQEKGYYRTKYKKEQFIKADKLAYEGLMPLQENLLENGDSAKEHAFKQAERIANKFNNEFKQLDAVFQKKMAQLDKCASNQKNTEAHMQVCKEKEKWLKNILKEVNAILDI